LADDGTALALPLRLISTVFDMSVP